MKLAQLQEARTIGSKLEQWIHQTARLIADRDDHESEVRYFDANEDPYDELVQLFGKSDDSTFRDSQRYYTWHIDDPTNTYKWLYLMYYPASKSPIVATSKAVVEIEPYIW